MTYHVLNGDALYERFHELNPGGATLIYRECLIDGDLGGANLSEFWQRRQRYLATAPVDYDRWVLQELRPLLGANADDTFCLWFGYDLFCQVNLWFLLSLLAVRSQLPTIYLVYPTYLPAARRWEEYGPATTKDLQYCFLNRQVATREDVNLGRALWEAYRSDNRSQLATLAKQATPGFPHLDEVVRAQLDRHPSATGNAARPERTIASILADGTEGFGPVFRRFLEREGVYGFGELQFQPLYEKVLKERG